MAEKTRKKTSQAEPRAIGKISPDRLYEISFSGRKGSGNCSAIGLRAGDWVLGVSGLTQVCLVSQDFEFTISADNQIRQYNASDLSKLSFRARVYRP